MYDYRKEPIPNIAHASKYMRWLYYYRLSHPYNMDLKKVYGPYTPQNVTTNELPQLLNLEYFITEQSSFLGTCGSGEQAFFAYLYGAKDNVFFDISYNAYWLTCLKMAAIKAFDDHTEYETFIRNLTENCKKTHSLLKVPNIYHVLQYLTDTQTKYIETMDKAGMSVVLYNKTCQFYSINQTDYNILKNSVELPIPFIPTDIRNLDEKLDDKKFTNVYLSNILCWVEPYEVEPILQKTKKRIAPNGNLFLMSDCNKIESMWTAARNVYQKPEWGIDTMFFPQDNTFQIIVHNNMQSISY